MAAVRVFRSYLKTPFLILLILEVTVFFASIYAAAWVRFINVPAAFYQIVDRLWVNAAMIAVIAPIAMLATGLYQGNIREGMSGILLRLAISLFATGVFVSLLVYLLPEYHLGRGILAYALLGSFFVIGTLRALFIELVDTEVFKKRVLVYGAGKTAAHIDAKLRRKSDRRSFRIVGYVPLDHQKQELKVDEAQLVDVDSDLLDYVRRNRIDEIVVATSDAIADVPVDDIVECKLNGVEVVDILTFFEREVGQVRIDIMDPSWLMFSEGFRTSELKDMVKRVFDLLSSSVILAIGAPFMLVTALAIKLEEGWHAPVFYHQLRVGLGQKPYKVYKFRSMRTDAEASGAKWASKTDDRVTRVGRIIRKTRIDELPQIFNVFKGEMSFVGPRPERPEFVENLAREIPYYNERHLVKPGITGWAQLMYPYGASVTDSYQKQLFDMYYIKNRNLFLDFLILLQTVEVVLFGKGAR